MSKVKDVDRDRRLCEEMKNIKPRMKAPEGYDRTDGEDSHSITKKGERLINQTPYNHSNAFVTVSVDGEVESIRSEYIIGLNSGFLKNTFEPRKIKGKRVIKKDNTGVFNMSSEEADKGIYVVGIRKGSGENVGLAFKNKIDKLVVYDHLLDFLNGAFSDLIINIKRKQLISIECTGIQDREPHESYRAIYQLSGDDSISGIKEDILDAMFLQGVVSTENSYEIHEYEIEQLCPKEYGKALKFMEIEVAANIKSMRKEFEKVYGKKRESDFDKLARKSIPTLGRFLIESRTKGVYVGTGKQEEFEEIFYNLTMGLHGCFKSSISWTDGFELKKNPFFSTIDFDDCFFFYVATVEFSIDKVNKDRVEVPTIM